MTGAEIRTAIREKFPEAVIDDLEGRDMDTVILKREHLIPVSLFLRDDPALDMDMLTDLTAIDWGRQREERFELVALYWSVQGGHRLRIKVPISADDPEYDTLSSVYKVANWLEREIYDMFGLKAKGHPNLRRILTHDQFEGHPLRKDYPVNRRQPIRATVEDLLTLRPYHGSERN